MQYSKFRPAQPPELKREPKPVPAAWAVLPGLVVGFAFTAALMVLLLLTQSQMSQMSFEVSRLEQQREALKVQNEKLLVAHGAAYNLKRIEQAALAMGMQHPEPGQYRDIEPR